MRIASLAVVPLFLLGCHTAACPEPTPPRQAAPPAATGSPPADDDAWRVPLDRLVGTWQFEVRTGGKPIR